MTRLVPNVIALISKHKDNFLNKDKGQDVVKNSNDNLLDKTKLISTKPATKTTVT